TPLSQMFRHEAVKKSGRLPGRGYIFLNLHSTEMVNSSFLTSIKALQGAKPANWQFVLEINENTVADLPSCRKLAAQLTELAVLPAYDDCGSGRGRLLELAELPRDFVKLDMRLVRNTHLTQPRQKMLQAFIEGSRNLGVQ